MLLEGRAPVFPRSSGVFSSREAPAMRIFLIRVCGYGPLMAQTGRRLAGEPTSPVQPRIQTAGCQAVGAALPANSIAPTDVVYLSRSECFGQCSAYKIRILAA